MSKQTQVVMNEAELKKVNEEAVENEAAVAEPAAEEQDNLSTTTENSAIERKNYTSKQEIIDQLKKLVQDNVLPERSETEYLKQCYYRLHNAEVLAQRDAFVAGGGNADEFLPAPDECEAEFKAQMNLLKERRSHHLAAVERSVRIIWNASWPLSKR